MRFWLTYLLLFTPHAWPADDAPKAPAPAPIAITAAEMSAFEALAQEQRVNAAELRAAQAEQGRLNEVAARLFTQACADRGITARDFSALREVCVVDREKGTITRRAPAKESPK